MQGNTSNYKTVTSTQYNSTQPTDIARSTAISGFFVILLPVVVIGAIVGYRKCKAMVLQQRINRLNRLWQIDSSQKLN